MLGKKRLLFFIGILTGVGSFLVSQESFSPREVAEELKELLKPSYCESYYTREQEGWLLSLSCQGDYTSQKREELLDYFFKNQYRFRSEKVRLLKREATYTYRFLTPKEERLTIKLYFQGGFFWGKEKRGKSLVSLVVFDLIRHRDLLMWQKLGIPTAYVIAPFYEESKKVAQKVREYFQQLFVATPLEPAKYYPAYGKVLKVEDIREDHYQDLLEEIASLSSSWDGISYRLGSSFIRDPYAVRKFLLFWKEKTRLFLDPNPQKGTIGKIARLMGYKVIGVDIILVGSTLKKIQKVWEEKVLPLLKKKKPLILMVYGGDKNAFRFLWKKLSSLKRKAQFVPLGEIYYHLEN